jgi:hypothetical protein
MSDVLIPKGYFPRTVVLPESLMAPVKVVPFQARLTFSKLTEQRVLFKDSYDVTWSIFLSSFPSMIPLLEKGSIEGMWKMSKKGAQWGLVWLGQEHMIQELPNTHNFPLLLNTLPLELLNDHLNMWQLSPEIEAMVEMTDFS